MGKATAGRPYDNRCDPILQEVLTLPPSDFWLSVAEAAQRSGCSAQSVRVRIRQGRFETLKRYGQWLINARSLQEYLRHASTHKSV